MKRLFLLALVFVIGCLGFVSGGNSCIKGYYYSNCTGECEWCNCHRLGVTGPGCRDGDGQCPCKDGYIRRRCTWCDKLNGWHGNQVFCCNETSHHSDNFTCKDCACNPDGVEKDLMNCTGLGQCNCRGGYTGLKCDKDAAQVMDLGTVNSGDYKCFKISCNGNCFVKHLKYKLSKEGFVHMKSATGPFVSPDLQGEKVCEASNFTTAECSNIQVNKNSFLVVLKTNVTAQMEFTYMVSKFSKIEKC